MATAVFTTACLTAHFFFPEDLFSLADNVPLIAARGVAAVVVFGLVMVARRIGARLAPAAIPVQILAGFAAMAIAFHALSAFHLFRFWVLLPILAVGTWGAEWRFPLPRRPVLIAIALFAMIPILVKATLPFFEGDELTMYLPMIREFVRQGSFDPVPRIEMLNTFTTGGFSLLSAAYALGGEGATIYLSLAFFLLALATVYSVTRIAAAPVLALVLCQSLLVDRMDSPAFVINGLGFAKLHALTAYCLVAMLAARRDGWLLVWLASFFAGVQFLGVVVAGLLCFYVERRMIPFLVIGVASWLAKPWLQVGCPFPAGIAPFFLTDLFTTSPRFYPQFYNHHFRHLFEAQNAALTKVGAYWGQLADLVKQFPFCLIAIGLPFCRNRVVLATLLLLLVINIPNPRYFIYLIPIFAASLGRYAAPALLVALFGLQIPRMLPFAGRLLVTTHPKSELLPVLVPEFGSTPLWVRDHLPDDARILHDNRDMWYFSNRATYQMNTTLGAASYQPQLEDVLAELGRARITHFFFSYFPRRSSPDQARLYSPLYEDVAFRSHFTLVHSAEDGLLFEFHPRATKPEPKYLLPIPPAARDVFVWR